MWSEGGCGNTRVRANQAGVRRKPTQVGGERTDRQPTAMADGDESGRQLSDAETSETRNTRTSELPDDGDSLRRDAEGSVNAGNGRDASPGDWRRGASVNCGNAR